MLQTQTIAPTTLQLLTRFMQDSELRSFRLVGGTALALQLGHRISVDLDLFTDSAFDEINFDEPVHLTNGKKVNWKMYEKRLLEMEKHPDKLFPALAK